jgi:hypothetical protein
MIPATFSTREKEEKPRPQSFARKGHRQRYEGEIEPQTFLPQWLQGSAYYSDGRVNATSLSEAFSLICVSTTVDNMFAFHHKTISS